MNAIKPLDEKVLAYLSDRIVFKPLTRWNDAYKEFPRYVMEYLCARYVDPAEPSIGQQKIDRLLSEHYVGSEAKELIKSKIKEKGVYTILGQFQVRLDAARDHYWAQGERILIHQRIFIVFSTSPHALPRQVFSINVAC